MVPKGRLRIMLRQAAGTALSLAIDRAIMQLAAGEVMAGMQTPFDHAQPRPFSSQSLLTMRSHGLFQVLIGLIRF